MRVRPIPSRLAASVTVRRSFGVALVVIVPPDGLEKRPESVVEPRSPMSEWFCMGLLGFGWSCATVDDPQMTMRGVSVSPGEGGSRTSRTIRTSAGQPWYGILTGTARAVPRFKPYRL